MNASSSRSVRIGVIGGGAMGASHAQKIQDGNIPNATLTAMCDSLPANLEKWDKVEKFTDASAMMKSGVIDAVVIVTPHFSHTPLSIAAFQAGLHVLVEKPLTVRKSDAEAIIAAHEKTDRVFAIMFNQRTDPLYQQVREWIRNGELGRIQRVQWTVTDWFRSDAYYQAGSWRGTWAGEGGGVLMNQAPHNLDLWQWLFGMPARVSAYGATGRFHPIEVEDDVTAVLEYADGTSGVFVTTTGEAPGVNRMEIAGDNGLVILEGRTLRFLRNAEPTASYTRTTPEKFMKPAVKEESLTFADSGPQHSGILENFVEAIREGKPLIAPGAEGIRSLELANAMTVSLVEHRTVELPMDAALFTSLLDTLIKANQK